MSDESHYIHTIRVERPIDFVPRRVVSLVPSLTETLFDLNLGNYLVGITDSCTRPTDRVGRLPKVGDPRNPDITRILALHPDLVLTNTDDNRQEDANALRAAGITVWETGPRSVMDAIQLLWLLMDVFEDASMTHRVRLIHSNYEMTRKYMTEGGTPVRVFVPIGRDPWVTVNAETYMHDLLYTCGAENIFGHRDDRHPRITLEEVADLQPELILLPTEPYAFGDVDMEDVRRQLANTPAARTRQIYLVDGSLLTWHGTRMAFALAELPPVIAAARAGQ